MTRYDDPMNRLDTWLTTEPEPRIDDTEMEDMDTRYEVLRTPTGDWMVLDTETGVNAAVGAKDRRIRYVYVDRSDAKHVAYMLNHQTDK